jgi:hypothetical protein
MMFGIRGDFELLELDTPQSHLSSQAGNMITPNLMAFRRQLILEPARAVCAPASFVRATDQGLQH